MKPQLLKLSDNVMHAFSARRDKMPDVNNRWHYHPEVELVYFKTGHGTQFIGDSINTFSSGDIALVGANLPHFWQFDDTFFNKFTHNPADVIVIHFKEMFWGEQFYQLTENADLRNLMNLAKRGVQIEGAAKHKVGSLMEQLVISQGLRKLVHLLDILSTVAENDANVCLASLGFQQNFPYSEKDRINAIYNYSIANFRKKITLEEIAGVANISPNSFCKYFKSRTRKTYSEFLIELRISNACRLLIENELPVKGVCLDSGFNNFASFHRFFRKNTDKTPLAYQKKFVKKPAVS